jgi:hypothetical protein
MCRYQSPRDEWPTRAELDGEAEAEAYFQGPDRAPEGAPGIRCGACHSRHETVADVRWCYDLKREAEAEARAEMEAEAAAEVAYARSREAQAEAGQWFGPQTEADTWG